MHPPGKTKLTGQGQSVQDQEQPEHLVQALNEYVLPHATADERLRAASRLHKQQVWARQLGCQSCTRVTVSSSVRLLIPRHQRGQTMSSMLQQWVLTQRPKGVHDEVHPQQLQHVQRGLTVAHSCHKSHHQRHEIYCQLEHEELADVAKDAASPQDCFHNGPEVVIHDDNICRLLGHLARSMLPRSRSPQLAGQATCATTATWSALAHQHTVDQQRTSVPAMPIARPTSDSFSAGASFVPSPVTLTTSPAAFSVCTSLNLSAGLERARTYTELH